MNDDNRLDQMQNMLDQLIVGNTTAMATETNRQIAELSKQVAETSTRLVNFELKVAARLDCIEKYMYRVKMLERRQDKSTLRVEAIETHLELLREKQQ